MAFQGNLFISSLPEEDRSALERLLQPVGLQLLDVLAFEGKRVAKVYFPITSIISKLVTSEEGKTFETTVVGRDGILSASPALDSRVSLSRSVVKVAGSALACDAEAFKRTVLGRPFLLSTVMRHEQTMFQQTQQNAACRAIHTPQQQVSRMLLRTKDLCDRVDIPLTQTLVAESLALRRTTISDAANVLRRKGLIRYVRGRITIQDVSGLRDEACGCYEIVRRHYRSLHKIERDGED